MVLRDGSEAIIQPYNSVDELPAEVFDQLFAIMNKVIRDGNTYPIEEELSKEEFKSYYCSYFLGVLLDKSIANKVIGSFYIKPNYAGRSSHVCNGGFLVNDEYRGKGAGVEMGKMYVKWAPLLGYKSSVFNLVYENNVASAKIWDKLGFKRVGLIPQVGRLNNSDELVNAIIFSKVF